MLWWIPLCSSQANCPWCHIMLDTVAPHMVQEADKENRVSNSLVCVRPVSRGPAGRKQRPGNSSAIKEEKVSSHYLHADPVDARSCVHVHAQTHTSKKGPCAHIVQYPFRIPVSLFVLYWFKMKIHLIVKVVQFQKSISVSSKKAIALYSSRGTGGPGDSS